METHPPICDYEGSDYQTSFWDESDRAYEDQVEAVALRRLLPSSGKLLLEIGAGAGRNTQRYAGYERIVVMDYSMSQLKKAKEHLGGSHRYIYVAADVYRLPFVDCLFDGATMIRVIHHIAEPSLALKQIRRVMQLGGTFILEFANKQNLKAIFRYILGRQAWSPFTQEPVEFVPLNFNFHPRFLRLQLKEGHFNLIRQLTVSHFRLAILKKLVPTKILVTLDSLAQFTGNWWQLTPSVFTKSIAAGELCNSPAPEGFFFRCPNCEQTLTDQTSTYMKCQNCGENWPIEDEIYDFRGKDPSKISG
jgi:SAM-dependent methyltransferase